jgi:CO/xanthine dehydrogenase FAD-binding subunit
MRGLVQHIEAVAPSTVEEALQVLASGAPWTPVAGGTDAYVLLNAGRSVGDRVISLHGLRPELRFVSLQGEKLKVGALATFRDLAASSGLIDRVPILAAAARTVGAAAIQCRGTVGGNIANASPAGDSLPVWAALDAEVELRSASGSRRVAFRDLFLGYRRIDRRADELLVAVHAKIPAPRVRQGYRKVGTRLAQAISKVVFAGTLELASGGAVKEVRLALGSVAATPVRLPRTEALLTGEKLTPALVARAAAEVRSEISPMDDVRSTAAYRLGVAGHLVAEFLSAS